MKRILAAIVLIGVLILSPFANAAANTSFLFPLPKDTYKSTNDTKGHGDYLEVDGNFKVDFQVAELPADKDLSPEKNEARCYSYGTPILAARLGKVIKMVSTGIHQNHTPDYGAHVVLQHDDDDDGEYDDSKSYYAHMISGTNDKYVAVNDIVESGQIIGLMGDTGYILSGLSKCVTDKNYGTHLHFETKNLKDAEGKNTTPLPLGPSKNTSIKKGNTYVSETIAYDPKGAYSQHHYKKYPYVLEVFKVHSITPLQVQAGTSQTFSISGNNFNAEAPLTITDKVCANQSYTYISKIKAEITCTISNNVGLQTGVFPSPDQPEGKLDYQIEVQAGQPSNVVGINTVTYPIPKPGEYLDLEVIGKNFPGDLYFDIHDNASSNSNRGPCNTKGQFYLLGSGRIKTRCKLPLNIGGVKKESIRTFSIKIYRNKASFQAKEAPLYSNEFDANYGISVDKVEPLKAIYFTTTRFTITGKNVHRLTTFYLEGCGEWKEVSRNYDQLVVECKKIQPLTNSEPKSLLGKTFKHLFLVKTRPRTQNGVTVSEEEDRQNTLISTRVVITHDPEERIDDITPKTAVVGRLTTFSVSGNRLPYTDSSEQQPAIWLEKCSGDNGSETINILPGSYTPYGFQFTCTPQFTAEEQAQNTALEQAYNISDEDDTVRTQKKQALWPQFKAFFDGLKLRTVHIKKVKGGTPDLAASVKFISALYEIIQEAESFQFRYPRVEGDFTITGPAKVSKTDPQRLNYQERHEIVTITGNSLPRSLQLVSDDCEQVVVKYASSEKYEFVCLIKKVARFSYQLIDTSTKQVIDQKTHRIIEIYSAAAEQKLNTEPATLIITGANLDSNLQVSGNECSALTLNSSSSSELSYSCSLVGSVSSPPSAIQLNVTDSSGQFTFYDELVIIERNNKESKNSSEPPTTYKLPTPSNPNVKVTPVTSTNSDGKTTFDAKVITLVCDGSASTELYIGECNAYSEFLREANVIASIDPIKQIGLVEGKFDSRLGTAVDNFTQSKLKGLKLNPASGSGMIMLDVPEQTFMMNGQFNALGIDATETLGFPFAFDMYDFSGEFVAVFPLFDVNKPRDKSKLVFGMGKIDHPSITLFAEERGELKKAIEKQIKLVNQGIQTKKIEIGAKLMDKISDYELRQLARYSYIKVLKELEIVPIKVAFYDNFDFEATGKLKSEPFKPANWGDTPWIAEANIAELDVDFVAKDAKMKIFGKALNELSIFNNTFIKADDGLLNAGLTIDLKTDNGRIDLDPVTVRLPQDIFTVQADAHVYQIFNPSQLGMLGRIKSEIKIKGIELAKAGAAFQLDPNLPYQVGDYQAIGLMRVQGNLLMYGIEMNGTSVFTMPGNQLAMDLGGSADLNFMGYKKRLGDVLSRTRIGENLSTCINSQTGTITVPYPTYFGFEFVDLHGEVSIEAKAKIEGFSVDPKELAMSAGTSTKDRIGVHVDLTKNIWNPFAYSDYTTKCSDAPGQDFFKHSLLSKAPLLPPSEVAQAFPPPLQKPLALASLDPSLIAQTQELQAKYQNPAGPILAQANDVQRELPAPTWDMTGWIILVPKDLGGNKIIIRDKDGKEIDYRKNRFAVGGMWFFADPDQFVIFNQDAFNEQGYEISVQQVTENGTDLIIASYTNELQTDNSFQLPKLQFNENALELQGVIDNHEIALKNQVFKANNVSTKPVTVASRTIDATVTSESYEDLIPKTPDSSLPTPDTFPDVPSSHPHSDAINQLASMGVINGYPDGSFKPDNTVNRAEFVKMILTALDYELIDKKTPSFKDSIKTDWHYPYIETAKFHEMIKGYSNRLVKPGQTIIKAEGLKIALEAAKLSIASSGSTSFTDVPANEWYAAYVKTALDAGIDLNLIGNAANRFEPGHEMTRGEVAELIVQILKR